MNRFLVRLTGIMTAAALLAAPAFAFNETGGSGLIRIEEAYSLPIGRPLFSIYAGAFSNNFTPGTSRMISATPSVTLGLGGGFEAAAAMGLEGLTSSLDGEAFDRRFDFRQRALQTKLRWTTELGGPRLRAGVLGNLTLPLWIDERPGASVEPADDRDIGAMGLVSANLGWFSFPLRLHLNAGYWWSRNDGAFIYRGLPTAIPVTGVAANRNDVVEYGMALEAGLRRAVVFVELRSEQFVDARSAVASRENLWQVTPGFRTQLTSSVGLTGGVTFDISSNDEGTAFDPATAYPDYELKLGLTLGSVLSRERREEAHRDAGRRAALAKASSAASAEAAAVVAAADATADVAEVEVMVPAPAPAPAPVAAPVTTDAMRIRELEERLARVETAQRIASLEARLAAVEGRGVIEPVPAPAPVLPAVAPAKVPAAPSAKADTVSAAKPLTAPAVPAPGAVAPTAAVKASASEVPAVKAESTPPVAAVTVPAVEAAAPAVEVAAVETRVAAPAVDVAVPAVEVADVKAEVPAPAVEVAAPAVEAAKVEAEVAAPAVEAVAPLAEVAKVEAEVAAPAVKVDEPAVEVTKVEAEVPAPAAEVAVPAVKAAEVKTEVAAPAASISPEVQAQLDLMQQEINVLRAEQAARLAATPPPSEPAAAQDRATVITNSGRSQMPSVVTVPVPATRPAAPAAVDPVPVAAPNAAAAGAEAGDQDELLPELLEPYQAPAPVEAVGAPAAAPLETASATVAPVAEVKTVPAFGLKPGARRLLAGVDATAAAPLASPTAQAELDSLASALAVWPGVGVVVLVHGGGTDRSAALAHTDSLAGLIKEYLVAAGAPLDSVMPLGMGLSEQPTPAVEVERIR